MASIVMTAFVFFAIACNLIAAVAIVYLAYSRNA